MAADTPLLDQVTESRTGDYLGDSKSNYMGLNTLKEAQEVYELAKRRNPQEVVDLSQEGIRPAIWNPIAHRRSDSSGAYVYTSTSHYNSQNLPIAQLGGFLSEGYGRVQSFGVAEPSFGIPVETESRSAYKRSSGGSSLDNEQERKVLTFPEGEDDAVTITERDMNGLQSTGFLGNNIIDFYIKHLERSLLSPEGRNRFHFFNSFFFTKLLGNSSSSTDIGQCEVDYEQVRKWTGAVNLFEKDYVFVPVLRSSHWSLIIICHPTAVSCSPDNRKGSLIVFHLDPIKGKHGSFEGQVRSYLLEAWMERYQAADNKDELLALCQMKYVQAEVPQQENGYDCGLYVLHYVEEFLREWTSADFSLALSSRGLRFTGPHFAAGVSAKRMDIEKLISELVRTSTAKQAAKSMEIQKLSHELRGVYQKLLTCLDGKGNGKDAVHLLAGGSAVDNQHQQCLTETIEQLDHPPTWKLALDTKPPDGVEVPRAEYQSAGDLVLDWHQQPKTLARPVVRKPPSGTNKRGRNWTEEETWILLNCKVEGGRFYKGNRGGTRWDIISQEIETRVGSMPSEDQCRLRYDTLLKAYKTSKNYCLKNGKPFCEISDEERRELKVAKTLMRQEWYEAIDVICRQGHHKATSQKRAKHSPSDDHGLVSLIPCNPAPLIQLAPVPTPASVPAPPIPAAAPIPTGSSKAVLEFCSLDVELRSMLLHLIQVLSLGRWLGRYTDGFVNQWTFKLEEVCQWLAVVQDRKPSDIRRILFKLSELKFAKIGYSEGGTEEFPRLKLSSLGVQGKFLEKVLRKNPAFVVYLQECGNYDSDSFPRAPLSPSLQRIRVLSLYKCQKLEDVNLSSFPELRCLDICDCNELKAITGWEVVKELGWLEICRCSSNADFPWVQCLPSLKTFCFKSFAIQMTPAADFSKCGRLRRLEIWGYSSLSLNSLDLSVLRFLEVLKSQFCAGLTTIEGLSGLHFLRKLVLVGCKALRGVPDLGCLKALTHLDLSWSGVEEIAGVRELHLLTHLDLSCCYSLKTVPRLGHLKALVRLCIGGSDVEEIPGVQELVSLERLHCWGSELKSLPDLHHLRRLQCVDVGDTPLSRTDPSSWYYGKGYIEYNSEEGRQGIGNIEISDVSDTEDNATQ